MDMEQRRGGGLAGVRARLQSARMERSENA